ncbi:hypothetical protein KUV57_12420 [Epibacterium sp. DP7N7-1]|nr:hypothetical protein [Epibacterium sp. DP7N7-1]
MNVLYNAVFLLAVWVAVFCLKYAGLSVVGQAYRHFLDWPWYVDIGLTFLFGVVWFAVTSAIVNAFGISLYHGMTADLSKERYTKVSYSGTIEPGFFSDTVRIKEHRTTSSEHDDMQQFFGFFMIADMVILGFGLIERYVVPQLQIW